MKCEIISIGSELTTGQNLDTNSQWLSQRLADIGIAVRWHTTLADDLEESCPLLQHLQQPLVDVELLVTEVFEQPGRASDVETLALRRERIQRSSDVVSGGDAA